MIPISIHEGKLIDESGEEVKADSNGIVTIEVEGKQKRFVYDKLLSYLERKGQVYKKPILRRNKAGKVRFKKTYKPREKNGKVGHHRRKKVVVTDKEGNEIEFESITQAAAKLPISACKMFPVLQGKRETLKGYKIKYAEN